MNDERDREIDRAYERALYFLSFRPRSLAEIRRNLASHSVAEETIEAVLQRMEASGLANDADFATFWSRNRQQFSPRSDRAVRQELHQKGVASEEIDAALVALPGEELRALKAGRMRLRSMREVDEREFHRRMMGFLSRRGFSYSISREASKTLYREATEAISESSGSTTE